MKKHYGDNDGLKVLSYGAIISAVLSNRNYGKSWTFKKRAFRRAMKHGKKTIWLRMFKEEVKQAIATFYTSKDLQAYCGISVYDKDTNPEGNFKQCGRTFYYRHNKKSKWNWFLKVFALSDAGAVRSADDIDTDTMVFDEFTKLPHIYNRYIGDPVHDFLDIFFSEKREHQIRCILLGNKESISNPFFNYFGIKPLPASYEGIRVFRKGSFVVQQINNIDEAKSDYDNKVSNLLDGTAYGNYIYKSEYKNATGIKTRKTPSNSSLYCQLYVNNQPLKISVLNGYFYINSRIDTNKRVYCDKLPHKFKRELLLVKRQKRFFVAFVNALADNRVYYDKEQNYESILPFLKWLSI